MTHLGIVVGMAHEMRCLAPLTEDSPVGHRVAVRVAGASPGRARAEAEALAAQGVDALLSFGVAGGLDPALHPGQLIVASSVIHPGATAQPTDPAWRAHLLDALPEAVEGPIVGSQRAIVRVREKQLHRSLSTALALDMESHSVAAAAGAAGLPFAAVRAVADPARRAVPLAATVGVDEEGETRAWPVAVILAFRPWQLPAVIRLALDHGKAMKALARCVGPGLLPPAQG